MTRADSGHHTNAKSEEKSATSASIADAMHPRPPQAQRNERMLQHGQPGGGHHHRHHHIRPRLRNAKPERTSNVASEHTCPPDDREAEDIDAMVERTRRRMQGLDVLDAGSSTAMAMASDTAGSPTTWTASERVNQTVDSSPGGDAVGENEIGSSSRSNIVADGGGGGDGKTRGILKKREDCRYQQKRPPRTGRGGEGDSSTRTLDSSSGFLKDEVVERRAPRPEGVEAEFEAQAKAERGPGAAASPFLTSSVEVEGYAPRSTSPSMRGTSFAADEEKTGIGGVAGEEVVADVDDSFDAKPMEIEDVDVTFACMSPEEYDETLRYAAEVEKGRRDDSDTGAEKKEVVCGDGKEGEGEEEKLASRIAKMRMRSGDDGDSDSDEIVIGHDVFPAEDDEDDEDPGLRPVNDGLEPKSDAGNEGDNGNATGDGSCALDLLGIAADEDDEEAISEEPPPRAFMELWKALSTWVTPEACRIVNHWQQTSAAAAVDDEDAEMDGTNGGNKMEEELYVQVDRTDVGSSRCGGLMAMLRLHLTRALRELEVLTEGRLDRMGDGSIDVDVDVGRLGRKFVEQRLGGLVRSFDYSRPMVDFPPSMWRAMTVILTSIALRGAGDGGSAMDVDFPSVLPESLKEVGLTKEEYRYLSASAIPSLDKGT